MTFQIAAIPNPQMTKQNSISVNSNNKNPISILYVTKNVLGFPGGEGKQSVCNAGDLDSIPGWGRSSGKGNGSPLQCSCLENSMDRGAWQAKVRGVTKSWT